MKLPLKAYEPEWQGNVISFYPRKNSVESNIQEIELPQWLYEIILQRDKRMFDKGFKDGQRQIRDLLGIKRQ